MGDDFMKLYPTRIMLASETWNNTQRSYISHLYPVSVDGYSSIWNPAGEIIVTIWEPESESQESKERLLEKIKEINTNPQVIKFG